MGLDPSSKAVANFAGNAVAVNEADVSWLAPTFAVIWTIVCVFLTQLARSKYCVNVKKRNWDGLQTLLLVLFLFSVFMYLVHHARAFAVPNGHSLYTLWVLFSAYFFLSSFLEICWFLDNWKVILKVYLLVVFERFSIYRFLEEANGKNRKWSLNRPPGAHRSSFVSYLRVWSTKFQAP